MKIKTQPDNYSCGIYSILNALLVFGDEKSPQEIKEYSGTTYRNGTSEGGIINAFNELGYTTKEYQTRNKNSAWRWTLNNSIKYPLLLPMDGYEHWAVVAGRILNKVILIDPANTAHILNKQELLERWGNNGWYWGLRIGK